MTSKVPDTQIVQHLNNANKALADVQTHIQTGQSLISAALAAITASAGTIAQDAAAVVGQVETGVSNTLDAAIAAKQALMNSLSAEYDALQKQVMAGARADISQGAVIIGKMKALVAETAQLKAQQKAQANEQSAKS